MVADQWGREEGLIPSSTSSLGGMRAKSWQDVIQQESAGWNSNPVNYVGCTEHDFSQVTHLKLPPNPGATSLLPKVQWP